MKAIELSWVSPTMNVDAIQRMGVLTLFDDPEIPLLRTCRRAAASLPVDGDALAKLREASAAWLAQVYPMWQSLQG